MSPFERHNEIAKRMFTEIVKATGGNAGEAMTIAESITFGLIVFHYGDPGLGMQAVDVMKDRLGERIQMLSMPASGETRQ